MLVVPYEFQQTMLLTLILIVDLYISNDLTTLRLAQPIVLSLLDLMGFSMPMPPSLSQSRHSILRLSPQSVLPLLDLLDLSNP